MTNKPPKNAIKTCTSVDCPERKGGECTAGEKTHTTNYMQVIDFHCLGCHKTFLYKDGVDPVEHFKECKVEKNDCTKECKIIKKSGGYKSESEDWQNEYPLNTFGGETKRELVEFIKKEKKDIFTKAKELLPQFFKEESSNVKHDSDCWVTREVDEKGMHKINCISYCPRKDYDGSRGRATVEIVNYLIWLEANL